MEIRTCAVTKTLVYLAVAFFAAALLWTTICMVGGSESIKLEEFKQQVTWHYIFCAFSLICSLMMCYWKPY